MLKISASASRLFLFALTLLSSAIATGATLTASHAEEKSLDLSLAAQGLTWETAGADWPGKVHSLEDLRQIQELPERLANQETLDQFGGLKSGPRPKATGKFRTEKVNGRHWLVTPVGHIFFSVGVNSVRHSGPSGIAGRGDWHQWLPDDRKAAIAEEVNFHLLNLERKYGASFLETWLEITPRRLKGWGFNTIGNWSEEDLWKSQSMAYRAGFATTHDVPDPFDPLFIKSVQSEVRQAVAKAGDDPWCLGYFSHNELDWGLWDNDASRIALARTIMATPSTPARRAFRSHLQNRYKSINSLTTECGITLDSWDEIENRKFEFGQDPAHGIVTSLKELTRFVAAEYFRVIADEIGKHDPGRLFLGTRFAERWCTPEVLEAAAEYSDLLCFNDYRAIIDPSNSLWRFVAGLNRPAMITEFHFGATDRGMFNGGMRWVDNQEDRASAHERHLRSAVETNFIVGCHWFQHVDHPLTGRGRDGENFAIGLLTVADVPHAELTESTRTTNASILKRALEHANTANP